LTLTLQELIHIRSVLTKAEIESLPVEGNFKEDVENRKVNINYFLEILKPNKKQFWFCRFASCV
jgi:hypothetical protein